MISERVWCPKDTEGKVGMQGHQGVGHMAMDANASKGVKEAFASGRIESFAKINEEYL